jgi:Leucine-rich repeat (LRR) protein
MRTHACCDDCSARPLPTKSRTNHWHRPHPPAGEGFPNLRVLNLDNNLISDLSSISNLTALAVLRLNHNRIESFVPGPRSNPGALPDGAAVGLHTLSALEVLQLGFNDIHSLAPLRTLPVGGLKVLFLQANDISKLEGLENLTQVRELGLPEAPSPEPWTSTLNPQPSPLSSPRSPEAVQRRVKAGFR